LAGRIGSHVGQNSVEGGYRVTLETGSAMPFLRSVVGTL
jgi:hypothetical protein